jgi:16S rRNA (adenine1518-N6/adenine1519-N6)-dimethyltransferase
LNLYDPATLKAFLGRHHLSASKGLGQHFLVSRAAVDRIVACVEDCVGICEIGPGPGVLTGPLSVSAERTIALELDAGMIAALCESAPKADVRMLDALNADLAAILEELPEPRAVVSNLPYYITAALLTRIAGARASLDMAVLMMQKEVARRVVAPPGDSARGSLSVFLQAQFSIKTICQVPAGAFMPPPKVDSTVLEFVPTETGLIHEQEESLFGFVRAGFAQPRKTLVNNLVATGLSREAALEFVTGAGLDPLVRPQNLGFNDWRDIWLATQSN